MVQVMPVAYSDDNSSKFVVDDPAGQLATVDGSYRLTLDADPTSPRWVASPEITVDHHSAPPGYLDAVQEALRPSAPIELVLAHSIPS